MNNGTAMRPITYASMLMVVLLSAAFAADVAAQPTADVESYEQSIRAIQREGGAMDPRLSEHLLGLGLAQRANGDLPAALESFRQALHVNRINKGLHHIVHVPIVDLLIETCVEMGDWQAVDQHQRFRFWIHRREVDTHSGEFVAAAMKYAGWQTRAYQLDTGKATYVKLREALDALEMALAAVTATDDTGDPRLIQILNAEAQARLNLATYVSTTDEDIVTGGVRMDEDFGDIIERRNLVIESYIRGKQALERVAGLTGEQNRDVEHALALANLADFELAFDRPQSATENYRLAYRQLEAAGLTAEEIEAEFGSPRPMKYFSVERRPLIVPAAEPGPNAFVTASFTVTKNGKVRSIKVIKANPPDNSRIVRRARTSLRETRFRPSIGDDGPFEDATTIRYVFPDVSI